MGKRSLQERTGALDWDELRTVLAVARAGSLAGAARELSVRHSTVFRRIEAAEKRLGSRLFERGRNGWSANARGEAVAGAAAEMEVAALGAERAIHGADDRLEGVIRIATSELLAGYLLPPLFARFLAEQTGVEIEVDVSNRSVDLTRREADLALRATLQPPEALVGRQVGLMRYAAFAPRSLLAGRRAAPVLQELPWVGFDERVSHLRIARWFREALPEVTPRLRFDSIPALLRAASAGAGAVLLPTFVAPLAPDLVRITPAVDGADMGLWLLNHPDARGNARVRALSGFLSRTVPEELARLEALGATCRTLAECPFARRAARGRKAAR